MSKKYIKNHFADIKKYANKIENRLDDDCSMEGMLEDNAHYLRKVRKYDLNYILIDNRYEINIVLDKS